MPLKRCRFALAAVVVLAGAGCKKPPPPPPPPAVELPVVGASDEDPKVWKARSLDQKAQLTQTPSTGGQCELTCELDGTQVWKGVVDCFAQKVDFRFVAPDCERTVMLYPSPSKAQGWRKAVLMHVYKRHMLDYEVLGPGVLRDESVLLNKGSWLQGSFGVAGEAPRYSEDGTAVEFTAVDGKPQSVPLLKK